MSRAIVTMIEEDDPVPDVCAYPCYPISFGARRPLADKHRDARVVFHGLCWRPYGRPRDAGDPCAMPDPAPDTCVARKERTTRLLWMVVGSNAAGETVCDWLTIPSICRADAGALCT